jgi:methionyl-tRNA formyltransferase
MTNYDIFAYNFPHWKTEQGLLNLVINCIDIKTVILQEKKQLSIPTSNYKFTPQNEFIIHPQDLCNQFNLKFKVSDHDEFEPTSEHAIILGARILKKSTVEKYKTILNLHPGILPGNRGLDNLKWSIINKLPIGVTAHFIDEKIDMGQIIATATIDINKHDTIESCYLKQRQLEQKLLIDVVTNPIKKTIPCTYSTKFSAVPDYLDVNIKKYFDEYISELPNIRQ